MDIESGRPEKAVSSSSWLAPATALRYYEKSRLLPRARRTPARYRAYDADVLDRLAFIRAAQTIGLSLAEICEVIGIRDGGAAPCAHVLQLLQQHRAEIRLHTRQLQQLARALAILADRGARVDPGECDPEGICSVIPSDPTVRRLPCRAPRAARATSSRRR